MPILDKTILCCLLLPAVLAVLSPFLQTVSAFSSSRLHGFPAFYRSQSLQEVYRISNPITVLLSKLSPKAGFDLDAIEAFESQLEELEQNNLDTTTTSSSTKTDDDDENVDSTQSTADEQTILTIPAELNKKRIDAAVAELLEPQLSRSTCGSLVADGSVSRILDNGDEEVLDRKSFKVETGMTLRVCLPKDEQPTEIVAQDLPLDILFEDEHMIVLNKAAHMVVHPAAGNWDGTVVNALAYYLPRSTYGRGDIVDENGKPIVTSNEAVEAETLDGQAIDESNTVSFRPGIVHRLDKGTTGILIVAKTSRALSALSKAFADRRVSKTYLAVTVGNPGSNVKIDKPIGRHPVHRQRMRVVPDPRLKNRENRLIPQSGLAASRAPSVAGRRALSYVDALAFDGKLALARIKIETGRTHQVCCCYSVGFADLSLPENIYTYTVIIHCFLLFTCNRFAFICKIDTRPSTGTRFMVLRIGTNALRKRIKLVVLCCMRISFPWNTPLRASNFNLQRPWIPI